VIENYRLFFESANIKVISKFAEDLPNVYADVSEIKIVIENLLENAIYYSKPKGTITIKIKYEEHPVFFYKFGLKEKKFVYFEIKDDGIGISKNEQKYIFQKFFRTEEAKKTNTKGSGLGLYIAKSIVERNGGKIMFSSEENKGSVFWFILPT